MALSLDEALGMSLADEADESIHVDVNTRQITIPESQQLFGVESDADVEVKHIVIDGRYADGTDLSTFTFRINYQNANGDKGTYLATELKVNDDSIEFDWVIGRQVVAYKGTIAFIVCAYTIDSSSVIQNEWNSTLGKGTVLEGLEVSEFDFGDDIVRQLAGILSDVNAAQASAKASADEAYKSKTEVVALGKEQQAAIEKKGKATLATIPNDYTQVSNDVSQLKKDTAKLKDGKISKFYASSQGNTNLPDSDSGRIMDLKLYGKSSQQQYTGKNLLPRFETTTSAGVTFTVDDNGVVTANGTATWFAQTAFDLPNETIVKLNSLVGTTLYLSGAKSAKRGRILLHLDYKDNSIQADSIYNYALNSNTSFALKGTVKSGYAQISGESGSAFSGDVFYPMLSTSADTAYEPYVGGIPLPNPEYPQEIKSVVKPVVKVCGKNLLDLRTGRSGVGEGVTYTRNDDGSYTRKGTSTGQSGNMWFLGAYTQETNTATLFVLKPGTYTVKDCVLFSGTNQRNGTFTVTNDWFVTGIRSPYMHVGVALDDTVYPRLMAGSTDTGWEPYTEQTATLPYTLNAIPVTSGGNVTIDGQQYIADYVDVERGKLVRMVEKAQPKQFDAWGKGLYHTIENGSTSLKAVKCDFLKNNQNLDALFAGTESGISLNGDQKQIVFYFDGVTADKAKELFEKYAVYYPLATPTETDLAADEIAAFKDLVSYYPVTNVSVTSDQLDGYTIFDYPISLAKGYDYIKAQLGDTRDYLYGIDLMTAEAYVNSEYAAALAEIEV